jgi:hypothetical protein
MPGIISLFNCRYPGEDEVSLKGGDFGEYLLKSRARIAQRLAKPILLEEIGTKVPHSHKWIRGQVERLGYREKGVLLHTSSDALFDECAGSFESLLAEVPFN